MTSSSSRWASRPARWLGWSAVAVVLLGACDERPPDIVPSVKVQIAIQLELPEFNHLTVPGNVLLVRHQGYMQHGVYVVHEAISPNTFSAYDATCPKHLDRARATRLVGTTANCPECATAYELLNYGLSADGNHRLQPYAVDARGATVYVHNP